MLQKLKCVSNPSPSLLPKGDNTVDALSEYAKASTCADSSRGPLPRNLHTRYGSSRCRQSLFTSARNCNPHLNPIMCCCSLTKQQQRTMGKRRRRQTGSVIRLFRKQKTKRKGHMFPGFICACYWIIWYLLCLQSIGFTKRNEKWILHYASLVSYCCTFEINTFSA